VDACEKLMAELNTAFQAASQEMYNAAQQAQANGDAHGPTGTSDPEVKDVDFEEVKDSK
jgi:molecular chaperone DnaK